jgi:hypothetical protein
MLAGCVFEVGCQAALLWVLCLFFIDFHCFRLLVMIISLRAAVAGLKVMFYCCFIVVYLADI